VAHGGIGGRVEGGGGGGGGGVNVSGLGIGERRGGDGVAAVSTNASLLTVLKHQF